MYLRKIISQLFSICKIFVCLLVANAVLAYAGHFETPVNPGASLLGGIQSISSTAHKWIDSISTAGVPHLSQPAAADLSDGVVGTGNVALQDTTTSFTPGISFGNATTGITYSSQLGSYIKIGDVTIANFTVVLSNKGSATGAARITGLPGVSERSTIGVCVISDFAGLTITQAVFAGIPAATSECDLYMWNSPNKTIISETSFSNTTSISGTAIYIVQ